MLLTVNVQDLLQQNPNERKEHAAKLRARMQELTEKLGVKAPVYVLVTKADLIGGFNESFESLGQEERNQVWGFTFDPATPADDPLRDFAPLYQGLQQRIVEQLVDRMEAERDVARRNAMFAFPQEFAALRLVLHDFLRQVFAGGGNLETAPRVRGVYFTSGTQAGSPIAGNWATRGFGSIVQLRPCTGTPDAMCGRIIWLWEPNDAQGRARTDNHNPDRALRTRSLIGIDIVQNLRETAPGVWSNGALYNPDDGRTYTGAITLRNGALELRGCALSVFCQTQVWRRPDDVLQAVRSLPQ